jgi:N-acetylneuraminate synthase
MVRLGNREVGGNNPTYIVAEIGANHNGDIEHALRLMQLAKEAGANAVKFQKRTPEICIPEDQKHTLKSTPWGDMEYLSYRLGLELTLGDYRKIDLKASSLSVDWFASVWDIPSVEFMEQYFNPIVYKIPSACLTDDPLLEAVGATGRPVILSTGMSTPGEVERALWNYEYSRAEEATDIIVCQCTSTYPLKPEEVNLKLICKWLEELEVRWDGLFQVVGYSGHEAGINISIAAVAMGARYIERHLTDDKTQWGSDQSMSLEPDEFKNLVDGIREVEAAFGTGIKEVYDSELPAMAKLRRKASVYV